MKKRRLIETVKEFRGVRLTIACAVLVFLSGCAAQSVKTHASGEVQQLDSKLNRGQSTQADVLLFLGEPDGAGEALLPTSDDAREIWYYESHASGLSSASMKVLLVYFREGVYDGYLWFENTSNITLN